MNRLGLPVVALWLAACALVCPAAEPTAVRAKPALRLVLDATTGKLTVMPTLPSGTRYRWKTVEGKAAVLVWIDAEGWPDAEGYEFSWDAPEPGPGPGPQPKPEPKPEPKPDPDPAPVPLAAVWAVVFEEPSARQPWQQAVDDWLEDTLRTEKGSQYRRYRMADLAGRMSSYKTHVGSTPPPVLVVIGMTDTGKPGAVLWAGPEPKTVAEMKALMAKWGVGK